MKIPKLSILNTNRKIYSKFIVKFIVKFTEKFIAKFRVKFIVKSIAKFIVKSKVIFIVKIVVKSKQYLSNFFCFGRPLFLFWGGSTRA